MGKIGELTTYLAGRYVEIKMYPFSFKESYEAVGKLKKGISPEKAFETYIDVGGYPFLYNFDLSESQRKQYLDDIFNSIILKDISDHGLRQSLFLKNQKDIGQVLENIVYVELLRRGYSVTIGKTAKQEIDFCARNEKGTEYFQVCYLLSSEETVKREFGAYALVPDNFPKYVLSLDRFDFSRNGIIHRNLIQWLLE